MNTNENVRVVDVFKSMWVESGPTRTKRMIGFLIVMTSLFALGFVQWAVENYAEVIAVTSFNFFLGLAKMFVVLITAIKIFAWFQKKHLKSSRRRA